MALKSTILLGTIDSQGTGGPFLAQALTTINMIHKSSIILIFNGDS
jgi:hypothetical protein